MSCEPILVKQVVFISSWIRLPIHQGLCGVLFKFNISVILNFNVILVTGRCDQKESLFN